MISKKKIVFLSKRKGYFDAMLPEISKKNDFNLKVLMTDQHLCKIWKHLFTM